MLGGETALLALGARLAATAERALLDAQLDALEAYVGNEETRELLATVYADGAARTLGELLEPQVLEEVVDRLLTARETQLLRVTLHHLLGLGVDGADDPARLADVPPPPTSVEALLAWARPYGLLGELSRPAREVLAELGREAPDASLLECFLGQVSFPESLLSAARVAEQARAHLSRAAAAEACLEVRRASWRRAPAAPLARLAERLRAVVGEMPLEVLHTARFLPAYLARVDDATGVARARFVAGEGLPSAEATLALLGYEQNALVGACTRCAGPGCLHVRALAGRLLDAALDHDDRLHGALASLTSEPSWRRFARALEAPPTPAPSTSARLAFRLEVRDGSVIVQALVEKQLAPGKWSRGERAAAGRLLHADFVREEDRAPLSLMRRAARGRTAEAVTADLALLRALSEHSRVLLAGGDGDTPARLSEARVDVTLRAAPGGLRPSLALAEKPVAPGVRPAVPGYLVQADPGRGALAFAALTPPLRRLLAALEAFHGVLPEESFPTIAPFFAALDGVARVHAPTALWGHEREVPRTLVLRISPRHDEGIDIGLYARPLPMSPLFTPGQGPSLAQGVEAGVHVHARRDLDDERARAEAIVQALGLERAVTTEPYCYPIDTTDAGLALLSAAARLGDSVTIEWAERARRLSIGGSVGAHDLSVGIRKRGSLLSLEGGAQVGALFVPIARLLDAARRNERFVRVEGRNYLELERALVERLEAAALVVSDGLRDATIPTESARFFVDALAGRAEAEDDETRAMLARALATTPSLDAVPEAWRTRLRDYQREGVAFLLDRSAWAPGVCLADEMGLGKTVQAIALLEARAHLGPALVVAPTSLGDNWASELRRFAPALRVALHRGADRPERLDDLTPGAVVIVSYDVLYRDQARLEGCRFATQIVDEAQVIKNLATRRARAVAAVDADYRVALTGTPIENRLGDLYSLMHLLCPGLLGGWARFRARFAVPIERYGDAERARALEALVAPFLLRRTKSEVAPSLPSRTEVVHRITLSPAERALYDAAAMQARRALGKRGRGENVETTQVLAELTRLRLLACHPRLVLHDERASSAKLAAFLELLEDVLPRGHRVLVFSQFTRHLAIVREALDARRLEHLYLDGATPAAERAALVARFQAGEGSLFLISLKAGGTGLNLTGADYVVHLDPWWNPAVEDQASDRAHRIGQERPITIVKLVAEGTIEERVLALHDDKRELAASILGGGAQALSRETLRELLAG